MTRDDDPFADSTTVATLQAVTALRMQSPFVLRVVEGPDQGRSVTVDASQPSRLYIGKSESCALRLQDHAVSRRHVALEVVDQKLRVTDLSSTNGTHVGGVWLGEVYLTGGEVIRLGDTAVAVSRGQPAPAAPLPRSRAFGSTLGKSKAMRRLYPLCERLAASDVPVIIEGETGTGKEQLAESLHQMSARKSEPFVVFDCTAVAPTLIESELFGHEQGSFTGATHLHRGVFEQASGGTLLIDEVGDMPLQLQSRLLRVIERFQVRRVGGSRPIAVDVRLLAATRRDLDRMVQQGRFRDDLFHRLAVARLELPPLRERREDIAELARHFWAERGGDPGRIPAELLREWEDYRWPGNVRELRNAVARRLALGDLAMGPRAGGESSGSEAEARERVASHPIATGGDPIAAVLALDLPLGETRQRIVNELERRYVQHVLDANGGNVTRAAAAAGVARRYFHRLKAKVSGR